MHGRAVQRTSSISRESSYGNTNGRSSTSSRLLRLPLPAPQSSSRALPPVEPGAICLIGFTREQCSLWRCRLFVSVYFIAFIHVYKDSISLVSHQSLLTPNLPVVPQLDPQVSTTPWLLLPPLGATGYEPRARCFRLRLIGCIDELSAGTWLSPLLSSMSRVFGCSPPLLHV